VVEKPWLVLGEDGGEGIILLALSSRAIGESRGIKGCPCFISVEAVAIAEVDDVKKLVVNHGADIKVVVAATRDVEVEVVVFRGVS
jgi:hypothetical protein